MAERGERDRRLALEQRTAQLPLQRADGVGQRRLGDAAASGRAGEIALRAQRQEVADLMHLHGVHLRACMSRGPCHRRSNPDGEVNHYPADFLPLLLATVTSRVSYDVCPYRRTATRIMKQLTFAI